MKIVDNGLTAKIFTELRKSGPFMPYDEADINIALQNTLYSVVIYDEDKPIGAARLVGDNRIAFFIKDVVVLPDYQGKRIGDTLMKQIFKYIDQHACEKAYVGLMSTPHKEGFYERYGFIKRPNEDFGAGMVMYYKGGNNK
ncbi:MAG: Acetyltransferase, family [Haloplasmataceae bacterium]|jgi:GNAT superfamily N-acetyltransferase|nr:Acetyltransferase, family [Haloplasmataceae bacterium]